MSTVERTPDLPEAAELPAQGGQAFPITPVAPNVAWRGHIFTPRPWQPPAVQRGIEACHHGECPLIQAEMGSGKSIALVEFCYIALPKSRTANRVIVILTPTKSLTTQLADTARIRIPDVGCYFTWAKDTDSDVIVCCYASAGKLALDLATKGRKVSLVVIDEAHKSETDEVKEAVRILAPAALIGFTATPYRADSREKLSLFTCVVYRYSLAQAIADGVLVPPQWHLPDVGGDAVDEIARPMMEAYCRGRGPGVTSAVDIADAVAHVETLEEWGWRAAAIHSKNSDKTNAKRMQMLKDGELDVLVHVNMLSEGVDMPWLRWIVLRAARGSRVQFKQEFGRVLRTLRTPDEHGPKTVGIILDLHGLSVTHAVNPEATVGDSEVDDRERDSSLLAFLENCCVPYESDAVEDIHNHYLGWFADRAPHGIEPETLQTLLHEIYLMDKTVDAFGRVERLSLRKGMPRKPKPITPVARVERWAHSLAYAVEMSGLAKGFGHRDRSSAPTKTQLGMLTLRAIRASALPEPHAEMVRRVALDPGEISRGGVSDLLTVLGACEGRDELPWDDRLLIVPPPLSAWPS